MRIVLAAAAGIAALAAAPRGADACRCRPPAPAADALSAADAVVLGEITATGEADGGAGGRMEVTLAAERWFKGGRGESAELITAASTATCGFPFEEGRRYVVYAKASEEPAGPLVVSLCSRTRPADKAEKDISVLERIAPESDPDPESESESESDPDPDPDPEPDPESDPPAASSSETQSSGGCATGRSAGFAPAALWFAAALAARGRRYSRGSKSSAAEFMQ